MPRKVFQHTTIYILLLQACGIAPNIRNSTFFHGLILSTSSLSIASTYYFDEKKYTIRTTDNTHGQLDTRITEEGVFDVHGNTLSMTPNIRLVCPKLVHEWQDRGQLVYTDQLKTDSFYIDGTQRCFDFSEYVTVNKDTLSIDNFNLLGFSTKTFTISVKDGRKELRSKDFRGHILLESRTGFSQ